LHFFLECSNVMESLLGYIYCHHNFAPGHWLKKAMWHVYCKYPIGTVNLYALARLGKEIVLECARGGQDQGIKDFLTIREGIEDENPGG
jgi:hypothetical protein